MIYTDSGRYAIRAVTRLASGDASSAPMTVAEIAKAEVNIPASYLAKILQDLARVGLLRSTRGRGGGFRLNRPPEEIRAIEVLDAVENIGRRSQICILALDRCSDHTPCPLHEAWVQFRSSALTYLHTLTVADLARARDRKSQHPSQEGDAIAGLLQ